MEASAGEKVEFVVNVPAEVWLPADSPRYVVGLDGMRRLQHMDTRAKAGTAGLDSLVLDMLTCASSNERGWTRLRR